ncbi:MAG TPA: peptidyl-alpha-hydroxyglycine alpha-amidating lyase family protein [Casimicrobiaceae bacterium]
METFGAGEYTYRAVEGWAKWPEDWNLHDVAGVGIDRNDNVYAFHRGDHPMVVFDRDGNVLRTWGEDVFRHAHGVHMGPEDTIYLTDDFDHTVRKCALDGSVLLTIGVPGEAAPFMSGEPFRRCTHTALSPRGDIYVSDGYGNARIHKYAPNGKRLLSWGEPGAGPGEFNLPHNIACDADGWVYVADRENHRIQVFDGNGRFERQWHDLHRPSGMYMPPGKSPVCYVGEIGPYYEFNRGAPNLGPRISILSNDGRPLARISTTPSAGTGPGQFISPHGLAVDSRGNLYVGEVCYTAWDSNFPGIPRPRRIRSLQKYERVRSPG